MSSSDEVIAALAAQLAAVTAQLAAVTAQVSAKDDQIGRLLVLVEGLSRRLDAALKLLEARDPVRAARERSEIATAKANLPPMPPGASEPPTPPPRPEPAEAPHLDVQFGDLGL